EAVRLYESILKDFPDYSRRDEVLFSLAYNLYEVDRTQDAVKRYEELIRHFPKSKFVPDVYVQLANHYFEVENNLDKARAMYERALGTGIPKIASYALYKLAWCDFNAGDQEAALKKLKEVVEFAGTRGGEMVDLKNEAMSDMVTVFVRLGRVDEGVAYFQAKASPKRQTQLISKLAYQLVDTGQHESAVRTFQTLIARDPMGPQAPEYQQAVVKSYEGLRERDRVKVEIRRMVELYRPGSAWWQKNGAQPDVLKNAFAATEEGMRTLVTEYHQEAQRTKQVDTYRLARDIYRQYVEAFATSDNPAFISDFAFNLSFYYAEILWALEEWDAAAGQYERVVAFQIPDRPTAKEVSQESYRKTAAYNAILAYDKLLKIDQGKIARSDLKSDQKVDERKRKPGVDGGDKVRKRSAKEAEGTLSAVEQKLVAACDRYIQLYPNSPEEIDIRYQAAVVHFDKNRFADATQRFSDIILKFPEERRSQDAADLTLSVLEERGEWLELNRRSRQFLANRKLAKPGTDFTQRVASVVEGSQYKWIDETVYRQEKNPTRAAEEFIKFVEEFPKSPNAARALSYAMVIFQETNQMERGIAAGQRALKEYGDSPFELKVRYTLAQFFERTADYARAAEGYEAFIAAFDRLNPASGKVIKANKAKGADTGGGDAERDVLLKEAEPWVADAQFNAALWWEAVGRNEKAIAGYAAYVKRYKDKKDVPEIQFSVGQLYEREKKWTEALRHYQAFNVDFANDLRATPVQHFLARYRRMLTQRAMGHTTESVKAAEELTQVYGRLAGKDKKDDRVRRAYAHARFIGTEALWKDYGELKLNRLASLKKDLAAKLKRIQEVERAYAGVLSIGDGEYGIASLTRIGLAYGDFAQNFFDSPTPPGLDDEQAELYRSELENRALPLEEKAAEALEKALAKSYELGLYTEWTLKAQDALNKYRPGSYGKVVQVPYRSSDSYAGTAVEASSPAPRTAEAGGR
ncbi:MAG TPA: tetratricopeptide repeat protein, partial [Myxococcaceae bacterium]|nr:tetratricopeptide repeat protein [Myxococcaceae bacterium]